MISTVNSINQFNFVMAVTWVFFGAGSVRKNTIKWATTQTKLFGFNILQNYGRLPYSPSTF